MAQASACAISFYIPLAQADACAILWGFFKGEFANPNAGIHPINLMLFHRVQ